MSYSTNGPGPTRRSIREGSMTPPTAPQPPGPLPVAASTVRPPTPWESIGPGAPTDPPDEPGDDGRGDGPFWRRMPVWLLVVIGVAVLGIVAAVVLLLTRPGTTEPLEPEVITLPLPTPTIEAIEPEAGTPFFESLPTEVLVWALTDYGEDEQMLIAGAVEAYLMVYSDGTRALTVQAGQWATAEAAEEAFAQLLAEEPPADDTATEEPPADDAATDDEATGDAADPAPLEPEEGIVEVDGTQVGRYVLRPTADGMGELWWTNQSVLIRISGPGEALRDVFAAFPL